MHATRIFLLVKGQHLNACHCHDYDTRLATSHQSKLVHVSGSAYEKYWVQNKKGLHNPAEIFHIQTGADVNILNCSSACTSWKCTYVSYKPEPFEMIATCCQRIQNDSQARWQITWNKLTKSKQLSFWNRSVLLQTFDCHVVLLQQIMPKATGFQLKLPVNFHPPQPLAHSPGQT